MIVGGRPLCFVESFEIDCELDIRWPSGEDIWADQQLFLAWDSIRDTL